MYILDEGISITASDNTLVTNSDKEKEGSLPKCVKIEVSRLTDVIEKLCIEANEHLPEDVKCAIKTLPCM